jgi:hypothetical protein
MPQSNTTSIRSEKTIVVTVKSRKGPHSRRLQSTVMIVGKPSVVEGILTLLQYKPHGQSLASVYDVDTVFELDAKSAPNVVHKSAFTRLLVEEC